MAIASFIPEIWSARLLHNFNRRIVIPALVNRNYEGEIKKYGDSVHINRLNDIAVKEYTPNTDIDDPDQLSTADTVLYIDHGAYFNFYLDDVDAAQARADLMDVATANAATRLAEDAEDYIIGIIRQEAGIKPMKTKPADGDALYKLVLEMKAQLDRNNVPRESRKLVLAPELEGMLLGSDLFVKSGVMAAENRLENGYVAKVLGFDVHVSNALEDEFIMMIPEAVTFANQLTEVKAYSPEKKFADAVKGLSLCGARVLQPTAVAVVTLIDE